MVYKMIWVIDVKLKSYFRLFEILSEWENGFRVLCCEIKNKEIRFHSNDVRNQWFARLRLMFNVSQIYILNIVVYAPNIIIC